MNVRLKSSDKHCHVVLSGRLDKHSVQHVHHEIFHSAKDKPHVDLDLSGVEEVSATGIRMLLLLCRSMACRGTEITLVGRTPALISALDAIGFLNLSQGCPWPTPADAAHRPLSHIDRVDIYPSRQIAGYPVRQGDPLPFGARVMEGGINFSIHSAHATACTLVLFDRSRPESETEIPIPEGFRIGNVFSIFVFGLDADQLEYGFRFGGLYEPKQGQRFDPTNVVIDPYAWAISGAPVWGEGRPAKRNYRSELIPGDFDWEDERPPKLAMEDLIIYEMHVRGFTRGESSGVTWPGTFAGLREKIPYLRQRGVNCAELMPIFEFDELDNPRHNPLTGEPLLNYWGYNSISFFAPKAGFAVTGRYSMQADEFKALVKELHQNGIEVLLDVVFNHSGEGDHSGPTISFRGIDNSTYYMLGPNGEYLNYSGTGNTLNCNHPVVRGMVIDSLRYWVSHYHIDGFRFDLASILGRSPSGEPLANPPLLEALAHDPVLAGCKLVAEAWDAAGLYQVGSFPSYGRWVEWNGKYRDTIRRFLKGDTGQVADLALRLVGSPDLYADRGPTGSINYVTCHDGFTLQDLVSYDEKHNEANGEENRDGNPANYSWNHGVEGPTDDSNILALRERQMKNAFAMLMVSQGVPMILMGDEVGRTQQGNNNAYCHDGPLTWFDWNLVRERASLFRFCQRMIAFRKAHPALRHSLHAGPAHESAESLEVTWHGVAPGRPDWSENSHSLAMMVRLTRPEGVADVVYVIMNMYWESLTFLLPTTGMEGHGWHLFADTAARSDFEIAEPGLEKPLVDQRFVLAKSRSVIILVAKPK